MQLKLAALLALVAAAAAAPPAHPVGECLDASYAGLGGLFPSTFRISPSTTIVGPIPTKVTVAQLFTIEYFDTYKLLTNLRANETYALYQCGLPAPSASELPAGTKVFSIPLTSVSSSDANSLVFMKMLGLQDRISYVSQFVVDPCLMKIGKFDCNRLDATYSMDGALMAQVAADVDAIMVYGTKNETDTKSVAVTASEDRGVLARAEWIKFVAAFFNKEDVANTWFSNITSSYQATNATVRAAVAGASRPLVAWLLWNPPLYGESVQISLAPYKMQYTEDAGGRNLVNSTVFPIALKYDTGASYQYDSVIVSNMSAAGDFLREALKDVDIVVDGNRYYTDNGTAIPNQDVTLDMFLAAFRLQQSDAQTLKFLKNGQILRTDATSNPDGYTDFLEMGVGRPDLVLQELAKAISPSALPALTISSPRFIRKLGAQPVRLLSAAQCPQTTCQTPLATICPAVYKSCTNGTLVAATPDQRCAPVCPATGTGPAPAPAPAPAPGTTAAPSPSPSPAAASTAVLPYLLQLAAVFVAVAAAIA